MNTGPSLEERMREELTRMRGEVPPVRVPPRSLVTRARRGMAASIAGVVLATALVVGGAVVAWNAVGSSRPDVPAATGTVSTPAPTISAGPSSAAELRSRPLTLPDVAPGAACPVTPAVTITPGLGAGFTGTTAAQRAGHVFLTFVGPHVGLRPSDRTPGGWYGLKAVWVVDGTYRGPFLIRGGRIDRSGPMQFRFDPQTPQQHGLFVDGVAAPLPGAPALWRSVPTATEIRGPGCYAYQIDGDGFSSHVVFEATR
jgi:hypothetical protein